MLMEQARKAKSKDFTPPDWRKFTPPELVDTVERVQAAGVKLLTSPDMREQVMAAVQSQNDTAKKLAENTVGLLLTLDQKSQGGIPVAALFPAAMALLGESAAVLTSAGQAVSQEDWNNAALQMFVLIGRKLGGTDEQIMQSAQQAFGGQEAEDQNEPGEPPEGTPADTTEDAAEGEAPDEEEQAMARGMQ
jgi:tRNA G37 N-methylase TrmD